MLSNFKAKGDIALEAFVSGLNGWFVAYSLPDDHGLNAVIAAHPEPSKRGAPFQDSIVQLIDEFTRHLSEVTSNGVIRFFATHVLGTNKAVDCQLESVVIDACGRPEWGSVPGYVAGDMLGRVIEVAEHCHGFEPSIEVRAEVEKLSDRDVGTISELARVIRDQ